MIELNHKILGTVGATKEESKIEMTDLQSLIELGCIKEEVEIGGIMFSIRSLSATERISLSKEFGKNELDEETMFNFNIKLLAIAVESVNGQPLESLHPKPSGNQISIKTDIISSLQTPVIAKLLESYANIAERCDKQFGLDQVKK